MAVTDGKETRGGAMSHSYLLLTTSSGLSGGEDAADSITASAFIHGEHPLILSLLSRRQQSKEPTQYMFTPC